MKQSSARLRRCHEYIGRSRTSRVIGSLQGSLQYRSMCALVGLSYIRIRNEALFGDGLLMAYPQWQRSLTGQACRHQSGGRNKLVTRFELEGVSSRLYTVPFIPVLMPTELKTGLFGFQKTLRELNNSRDCHNSLCQVSLLFESACSSGAFCLVEG